MGSILSRHYVYFHLYADDLQIYLPVQSNSLSALESIHMCLKDIKIGLSHNFLCLNVSKAECIVFASFKPSNNHSIVPDLWPLTLTMWSEIWV